MSTIGSVGNIDGKKTGNVPQETAARVPTDASTELAKLESQLSDWVDCPSGKTTAGKAHIAEITRQIDAIKTQLKKAAEHGVPKAVPGQPVEGANPARQRIRLDGLGTSLDVQA